MGANRIGNAYVIALPESANGYAVPNSFMTQAPAIIYIWRNINEDLNVSSIDTRIYPHAEKP